MKRYRGVTLIESVLFIVIALAVFVGGLVFFQQASESTRVNDAVRSIVSLQSSIRQSFQSEAGFGADGVDLDTHVGARVGRGDVGTFLVVVGCSFCLREDAAPCKD